MWIVRLALQRPYTFIVMAMVIILLTPLVLLRTPTDIFPDINIPVISLVWTFTGLEPQEMEQRITGPVERGIAGSGRRKAVSGSWGCRLRGPPGQGPLRCGHRQSRQPAKSDLAHRYRQTRHARIQRRDDRQSPLYR